MDVNDLLTKPVYDVAFYGEDKIIPLGTDTLTVQNITWSAIDELLQTRPANADVHIEDYSRLVSDVDTLGFMHEGDGVRYDRTFEWLSDMSAWVYKFNITIGICLDVTAFTSGTHSITSVRFRVSERLTDGTLVKQIADQTINTLMTDIGAVLTKVAIVEFEGNQPFKISQGNLVRLQITFNSIDTDVATSFEGLLPLFYFQEGSQVKQQIESAMILHLHPALDHAFPVFRDESIQEQLDYSGLTKNNVHRTPLPIGFPRPQIDPRPPIKRRRGIEGVEDEGSIGIFPEDTGVSGM